MAIQGYVWLCRAKYGYVGLCMAMYGCVWLCRAMYGCVRLCTAMQGCVGMCMAMQGYVWLCRALYGPMNYSYCLAEECSWVITAGQMSPLAGGRYGSPVVSPTGSLDRPSARVSRFCFMDLPRRPVGPTLVQHPPGRPHQNLFTSAHKVSGEFQVEFNKCSTVA